MTKMMNRIAAAGALLLLNGAVALAQSDMKLDVPFAFETPNAQMPAGKYYITELNGVRTAPFYRVQHAETGKAVVLVAPNSVFRKMNAVNLPAQVAFKCVADTCAIAEIYSLGQTHGHSVPVKLKKAPGAQVATIMVSAAAE